MTLALALLLGGCDKDDGDTEDTDSDVGLTLDCAFFAGDNCWKQTTLEAAACLPEDPTGTFDAGRTTCTLAGGEATVTFAEPVPAEMPDDWAFSFEITRPGDGAPCGGFSNTEASMSVSSASGTAREETLGFGMDVTCPDGTLYHTDSAFSILECDLGTLPMVAWSIGGGSAWLSVSGGSEEATFSFSCADPA